MWLHVGGHTEPSEHILQTLNREILEEVNLEVECVEQYDYFPKALHREEMLQLPRPFYIHFNKEQNTVKYDFVCVAKNISTLKLQDEELEAYKWYTREEIKNAPELIEPLRVLALHAFKVYNSNKSLK